MTHLALWQWTADLIAATVTYIAYVVPLISVGIAVIVVVDVVIVGSVTVQLM